ncbi:class I SAM-dependent methyltransferase [Elusimicrobiota bacterium]
MKKALYDFIVRLGMKVLGKIFPDIHMSTPLKPSDRFLEYPFVFGRLAPKSARVLDIGSSGSFFPLIAASLGHDVTGCDIRSYEILNHLSFNNFKFIQRDIVKDPLEENSFDVVTCISTIEHVGLGGRHGADVSDDGDIIMAKQILRVLKPGGKALITIPYGISEVVAPHHRIYDQNRIKMLESGFEVAEEEFYLMNNYGDWAKCSAQEGEKIRGGVNKYGLALLHLTKGKSA